MSGYPRKNGYVSSSEGRPDLDTAAADVAVWSATVCTMRTSCSPHHGSLSSSAPPRRTAPGATPMIRLNARLNAASDW